MSRHSFFFFFNDTATTEIYTLSLHDALPISSPEPAWACSSRASSSRRSAPSCGSRRSPAPSAVTRSEEHTSELQSQSNLVCRLLLEKKKNNIKSEMVWLLQRQDRSTVSDNLH